MSINFTSNAAKRISEIKTDDLPYFRIRVAGGGCQGFSYEMTQDSNINDDDQTFETDGETLIIDKTSLEFMDGSTVDYKQELIGAAFQIDNPQSKSSCGCGTSFAV